MGDLTLEEAKARARGFRVGLIRVEDYFKGTNIVAHAGPPPSDTTDYCWGGCPGAMEEAIEIVRLFDGHTDAKMPRTHLIFGAYDGPVDAAPGERVVMIGDCATYSGEIHGRQVSEKSTYVDRSNKDPYRATDEDIFAKIVKTNYRMWQSRDDDLFRMRGCPVSVAEQVLMLVKLGRLKNPYFDMSQAWSFTNAYFGKKTHDAIQRILGVPYQTAEGDKADPRGLARPSQNEPPDSAARRLEATKT